MSDLIIYTSEDGQARLELRVIDGPHQVDATGDCKTVSTDEAERQSARQII